MKTSMIKAICLLLGCFSIILPDLTSFSKEIYRWVDEKGVIHFTEDESEVPEEHREQTQKRSVPESPQVAPEPSGGKPRLEKVTGRGPAGKTAEREALNVNRIESDVMESIKSILTLWKNGKYDALYDCGDLNSQVALEKGNFCRQMSRRGLRLASSWEMLRDIQVTVKSPVLAYATVRMGSRPEKGGETRFRTETYRMRFEDGMWRVDLRKIMSAKE